METIQLLQVIYYVILIVAILFIILLFLWPYIAPIDNDIEGDEEFPADNLEDEINSNTRAQQNDKKKIVTERDYRPIASFQLTEPNQKGESITITYRQFQKLYKQADFIANFTEALNVSFREKLKRYRQMSRQVTQDYNKLNANAGYFPSHNTPLQRLRKSKQELEVIIRALQERIRKLDHKSTYDGIHKALTNPVSGLASLIGREDIKDNMCFQLYSFARNPYNFYNNHQNMAIYGPSGIGKTKVADVIGYVYSAAGIQARRKFRAITKNELTSPYVNEAPELTREQLDTCREGVLFIDEAYELAPDKRIMHRVTDHGSEAITEMVNFLDKNKGLIVVIVAGYEKEMENRFMSSNEGIPRRFPNILKLPPYNAKELTDILMSFIVSSSPNLYISEDECNYLYSLVAAIYKHNARIFDKQAGDMENLSNCLVTSIHGSQKVIWIDNNIHNNHKLLLAGFNRFLNQKNVQFNLQQTRISNNRLSPGGQVTTAQIYKNKTSADVDTSCNHGEAKTNLQIKSPIGIVRAS